MLAHRVMLFNPRYRAAGMLAYPFFFFGEMLAPLVELVGWVGLALGLSVGLVDRQFALLFWPWPWGSAPCSRSGPSCLRRRRSAVTVVRPT